MAHKTLTRLPRYDRKHKLDLIGAGLMMASAIPLLLALTWGGSRYPWFSPPIVALLVASAVLSMLFAWRLTQRIRAVPAAAHARQSGDAHGHALHLVLARRGDRAHHLPAALLRGRA